MGTLKFERSKVCTETHTSANKSRFFVPWEAGGPSPNQQASATPPRIWNIPIYGANVAAGLSGQKFERSKVCIREYISLFCALGCGRSVPESARLCNTSANMEYTYLRSEHSGGTVKTEREVQLAYASERLVCTRIHLASLCPGRREVRPRISMPLQHLREYGIYLSTERT